MKLNSIISLEKCQEAIQNSAYEIQQAFPDLPFDYAGMIPANDKSSRYDCTPLNTLVFAHTGGEGVHYSLLKISGSIQPIVMTVPMNFGNSLKGYNRILGENLNEFLSLGYYNGWFSLEQLCYQPDWAIDFYNNEWPDDELQSRGDFQFIKKLRSKLGYEHLPLNLNRLKALEEKYFDQLQFKDSII